MPPSNIYQALAAWDGPWPVAATARAPSDLPSQNATRVVRLWGRRRVGTDLVLIWEDHDGHRWEEGLVIPAPGSRTTSALELVEVELPEAR